MRVFDTLRQDARYALRILLQSRGGGWLSSHNKSFSGVFAFGEGRAPAAMQVPKDGAHATTGKHHIGLDAIILRCSGYIGRWASVHNSRPTRPKMQHPWAGLDYGFWQVDSAATHVSTDRCHAEREFTGAVVCNHANLYLPIMMLRQIQHGVRQWNTVISRGSQCLPA